MSDSLTSPGTNVYGSVHPSVDRIVLDTIDAQITTNHLKLDLVVRGYYRAEYAPDLEGRSTDGVDFGSSDQSETVRKD